MNYETDWRDTARHFANACFVGSYLCMSHGMLVFGALFTVVGETALAPSALKHKSWSTVFSGPWLSPRQLIQVILHHDR